MDESVMKHLNYGSYDVLMFYDYNTLDTDFDFKSLEKYEKKVCLHSFDELSFFRSHSHIVWNALPFYIFLTENLISYYHQFIL